MIAENIIPRNVIINRGAAGVDNHISRDDIFVFHPIRECNFYFIIPNITDPLFSTVLGLPWWEEFQRENNAQPPIDMHEWKYIFHKIVSIDQFECSNWSWRSVKQITP